VESPENVVKIAVHVNNKLKEFLASGKPQWAADSSVKMADRYAQAWHQNQRILAFNEQAFNNFRNEQQGMS